MASQSLISAVNSYDNYIQRKGIDEQVIDAYIEACRVAINSEKDALVAGWFPRDFNLF